MQSGLSYDEPAGVGRTLWGEEALEPGGSHQRDRDNISAAHDNQSARSWPWHDFLVLIFCVSVMLTVLNAPIIEHDPWLLLSLSTISLGIAYYIHIRMFHPRNAATDLSTQRSIDNVDAILWRADAKNGDRNFINSQAEDLLGFPIKHLESFSFFSSHVHPEDLGDLIQSQRDSRNGKGTDCSYRFRDYWGRTRYLHERVSVSYDEQMDSVSRHGIILDETRQWEAEEASRRYQQLIENVSSAVMIVQCAPTQTSPSVIHHNPAMADLYDRLFVKHQVNLTATIEPEICVQLMNQQLALHVDPAHAATSDVTLLDDETAALVAWQSTLLGQIHTASEDDSEQSIALYGSGQATLRIRCIPMSKRHVGIMVEDITIEVDEQHQLRFLASHDPLTQLANRATLFDCINSLIEQHPESAFSVAVFDLDEFKSVNDNYGHEIGDRVLCEFSDRLATSLQGIGLVARIGGDEFAAVSLHGVDVPTWNAALQGTHRAAQSPLEVQGLQLMAQASIGCAEYPRDARSIEDLFRCADQAMYRAKFAGGGIRHHEVHITQRGGRIGLIGELHSLSNSDEVQVEYHLRRSTVDNSVLGANAMPYWQHPSQGKLTPLQLLDSGVAPRYDLSIDRSTTRVALDQLVATPQLESAHTVSNIDITLSAESIRDPELCLWISEAIDGLRLDPSSVCFAVREQDILDVGTVAITALWQLQSLGVKVGAADCTGEHLSVSDFSILPICQLFLSSDIADAIARGNHTTFNVLRQLAVELDATVHATMSDNPVVTNYFRDHGVATLLDPHPAVDLQRR